MFLFALHANKNKHIYTLTHTYIHTVSIECTLFFAVAYLGTAINRIYVVLCIQGHAFIECMLFYVSRDSHPYVQAINRLGEAVVYRML